MAIDPAPISSLDIPPEKLREMNDALRVHLNKMYRVLGNPDDIDQRKLGDAIKAIMKDLPGGILREFDKPLLEEITTDFAQVITEFVQRVKGRTPTEGDIGMALDGLIFSLMKHHSVALAVKKNLDMVPAILDPKYQPLIKGGNYSVIGHRIMTLVTWLASSYTTNEYVKQHVDLVASGKLFGGFFKKMTTETAKMLKTWASPAIAIVFSQIVRIIKDDAEKIALHEKVSGLKGILKSIGRPFTKNPNATDPVADVALTNANRKMGIFVASGAASYVAIKLLVVLLDVWSNATGSSVVELKGEVVQAAIEKGKRDIEARRDDVRNKIGAMHADETIPADLSAAPVDTDVATVKFGKMAKKDEKDELEGKGVTGAGGAGGMYHSKKYMYEDALVSRQYLEMDADAIMADAVTRGKPMALARATEQAQLRKEFLKAIDDSGVASNSVSLPDEVSQTMEAKFTKVHKLLDEIEALKGPGHLNPESDQGDLEAEFKVMTDKLQEISDILNKELPKDVNANLGRYNALNERLAEIAGRYPAIYPGYKATRMEPWVLGKIDINTDKITIPRPPSVDETNLVKFMRDNWGGALVDAPKDEKGRCDYPSGKMKSLASPKVAWKISLYLLASLMMSYGDMILFLKFSRKAYERDDVEARKKRDEWIKNYREKIIHILTSQLNSMILGEHFYGAGLEIAPETVAEALDKRVEEITTEALTSNKKLGRDSWIVRWGSRIVPFSAPADYAGYTEVAQRHNAKIRAYQQVLGSADEMGKLLQYCLPGLNVVVEPGLGDAHEGVVEINRGVIMERNDALQAKSIGSIRQKIENISETTDESTSAVDWEKQWAALNAQEAALDALNPQVTDKNRDTYDEVVVLLHETQRDLEHVLAEIVKHENLNAEVSSADSDESLLDRRNILQRLEDLLERLDTSKNIDFATVVNSALRGITVAIGAIDAAREEKRLDSLQDERREDMRGVLEPAELDVEKAKKWSRANRPGESDAMRAESLATLLGHRLAVKSLKAGAKIPKDVAADLEEKYDAMLKNLGEIYHAYPTRHDEIQELGNELKAARSVLRAYFASSVNLLPPPESSDTDVDEVSSGTSS